MTVAHRPLFRFEASEFLDLEGLFVPWQPAPVPAPELLVLNEGLAGELGVDVAALTGPDGVAVLAGNAVPDDAVPVAQAYAGHQFGAYAPVLGDGRALLLGTVRDVHGRLRDLHMKGSGRTPFARGGDGKAAVGPMLREYVIGEAMHGLGIPTTRALAVVATGDRVRRDTILDGAVLTRVAASHLRVGTFQFAATHPDRTLVRRLADHAIARHFPHLDVRHRDGADAGDDGRYLRFFDAVVDAQATLVARWMLVGFVHGVMNTDNTTISGETIDYGPCAFMDAHDEGTVFSSIDLGGRYAYGNQPRIAHWNLARLAETLLSLFDDDTEQAIAAGNAVLQTFPERYRARWTAGMRVKLGIDGSGPADDEIVSDLAALMQAQRTDHTSSFRALAAALRGDDGRARSLFAEPAPFDAWYARWRERVHAGGRDPRAVADELDLVNPVYVPRNHLVEEALAAASAGDVAPLRRLTDVVSRPFDERPGLERYAEPAPVGFGPYQTFCGT